MSLNPARFCGGLLVSGFVVFMVGALFWRFAFQGPDMTETLRSIGAERGRWFWIHTWIAAGTVLSSAGLVVWIDVQRRAGETLLTPIGVAIFLIGAVLWLIAIGIRV